MSIPSHLNIEAMAMPSRLRTFYQAQRPEIELVLEGQGRTYSTLDQLKGEVSITAPIDTSFDDIEIEFVGTARTYVERMTTAAAISGRSEAFHQFLKLQQPRLSQLYPEGRILRAGQVYKFPFFFVVPSQLLPRICQHKVDSPSLRDHHLQLPPSFGDKEADGTTVAHDETVPDMASIRYGVFARITSTKEQSGEWMRVAIASKAKRVRIMPVTAEQPPLDVDGAQSEYTMRREKAIKKGMLKGKLGTLVMEAAQPPSLRMQVTKHSELHSTPMATIMLRFDPVDENVQPPRLHSLSSKLRVLTYFASAARSSLPTQQGPLLDVTQGLHTEHVNLSSRCMANVEWTKHHPAKPESIERRDSAHSVTSLTTGVTPNPSESYKGQSYYVARILAPITLPNGKAFTPTFHSCLVSRVYRLKLELSLQNAGLGSNVELKIPLQFLSEVASTGSPRSHPSSVHSTSESDEEEADVSDFFAPRTIHAPAVDFVGRSRIGSYAPGDDAPPGYSPFGTTPAGRSASVPGF